MIDLQFKTMVTLIKLFLIVGGLLKLNGNIIPDTFSTYSLTEIKFADLLTLDESALEKVTSALTDVGALQISGIPRYSMVRKRALEDLAECFLEENTAAEITMKDGARRVSCGAGSYGGKAEAMNHVCGEASNKLRAVADGAMRQLFVALDAAVDLHQKKMNKMNNKKKNKALLMSPYDSFQSLMAAGDHLEHLHAYYAPSHSLSHEQHHPNHPHNQPYQQEDRSSHTPLHSHRHITNSIQTTLDFHVDGGLMIAMTTGYYSHAASRESGLYLKLSTDEIVKAVADDDALIVLIGDGASRWLSPVLGKALRSLPHALVADLHHYDHDGDAGDIVSAEAVDADAEEKRRAVSHSDSISHSHSRSWYGKMYLPPSNAMIPQEQISYGEYRQLVNDHAMMLTQAQEQQGQQEQQEMGQEVDDGDEEKKKKKKAVQLSDLLPSACGGPGRQLIVTVGDNCPADQIWCWARCMDASAVSCNGNSELVCLDFDTQEPLSGDNMCMSGSEIYCGPGCYVASSHNSSANGFCVGDGTTMFMSGFVSYATATSDDEPECVKLWFDSWVLDNRSKYVISCVGIFLVSMLMQAVPLLRKYLKHKVRDARKRNFLTVLLFGIDSTVAYLIMLVTMTYSAELFSMVIAGLTVGFIIFHIHNPDNARWGDACCDHNGDHGNTFEGLEIGHTRGFRKKNEENDPVENLLLATNNCDNHGIHHDDERKEQLDDEECCCQDNVN